MIQCVAFDLDGVLIPSGPSFDYFKTKHNITPADFGEFFRGSYELAMSGRRIYLKFSRTHFRNGSGKELSKNLLKFGSILAQMPTQTHFRL